LSFQAKAKTHVRFTGSSIRSTRWPSIERVAKLLTQHNAQLWIGHDKDITSKIDRAPSFINS
jgi:hypothetical protein